MYRYHITTIALLELLCQRVLTDKVCTQEQLGSTVTINCPPPDKADFGYCCNDNGRITCCTYNDYLYREQGRSSEAIIILIVSSFLALTIIAILCFIRWKRSFLKSVSSEQKNVRMPSDMLSNTQITQKAEKKKVTSQNSKIPPSRFAEVLQAIYNEKEPISSTETVTSSKSRRFR